MENFNYKEIEGTPECIKERNRGVMCVREADVPSILDFIFVYNNMPAENINYGT